MIVHLDEPALRRKQSAKWTHYPPHVLPAWVADHDFPTAPAVLDVLETIARTSDLGYPPIRGPLAEALANAARARCEQKYGWSFSDLGGEPLVEPLGDVVQGIYTALSTLTQPGDGVVVQTPVYPPFLTAVRDLGRKLVLAPLGLEGGRYVLDTEKLDTILSREPARALLLCHPQNPTGRVFDAGELRALGEVCLRHDLYVVSDEIHADLTYTPRSFQSILAAVPELSSTTVTLTSASKAFAIPGLHCAVAVFASRALHQRFMQVPAHLRGAPSGPGIRATVAAWTKGDAWLTELLETLRDHRDLVSPWAVARGIPFTQPEATYLAWLDLRPLGLSAPELVERAAVALSDGEPFGAVGFARLNFGTSRPVLDEILARLSKVLPPQPDSAGK